jgi:hypothetical protein
VAHDHVARATADAHARVIESVAVLRLQTKVRTVLRVMGYVKGKDGNRRVHVRLPGRPGCIRLSASAITWPSKRIGGGAPATTER